MAAHRLKTKGLKLIKSNGESITYYIYKNKKSAPYGCCVDCGDYYEIALYSWYIRIDKEAMTGISNFKDVNEYLPHDGCKAEIVRLKPAYQIAA